jgi:hypothetical protein
MTPEEYAKQKLAYINARYGTGHGDEYLRLLVQECQRQEEFTEKCEENHKNIKESVMRMDNFCVICGEVIVEGRQVCHRCMASASVVPSANLRDLMEAKLILCYAPKIGFVIEVRKIIDRVIGRLENNG